MWSTEASATTEAQPEAVWELWTDVRPGEGFSDRTRLPLANLDFFHKTERVGEGTRVTHRVEISGPLSFAFARLMGRGFEEGLPETVRNLARLAEVREGARP